MNNFKGLFFEISANPISSKKTIEIILSLLSFLLVFLLPLIIFLAFLNIFITPFDVDVKDP